MLKQFLTAFAVAGLVMAVATPSVPAEVRGPGSLTAQAPATAGSEVSAPGVRVEQSGARLRPADELGRYTYIIRFPEASLARYEGGIPGLRATSARVTGQRIDVNSPDARAYLSFLESRQDQYLSAIRQVTSRSVRPSLELRNVLNGAIIALTPEEAARVETLPFVVSMERDWEDELLTDEGPALVRAPEVWAGETLSGLENRGEGIIIGIIDSGFNHGHPSFTEVASDGFEHVNPYGDGVFTGLCADPNAEDFEDVCNNKVIGTYNLHPDSVSSDDTASSGHGTHVGSTAAGNPLSIVFPFHYLDLDVDISGVAPRANLINYKVCEPTCPASSRVAAVDFAIADGVHVLNHSIGNSEPPWASSVSLAFLDANAAGIVVAASAGNSGPGPSTAASTGPWNLAVGASTHQRRLAFLLTVEGEPTEYSAAPSGPNLPGPFIGDLRYAGDVDPDNFLGCEPFPDNAFAGEAALMLRGACSFAQKVANAYNAGASLAVIANNEPGLFGMAGLEDAPITAIAVSNVTGDALIDLLDGDTREIDVFALIDVDPDNADAMAGFSSRGPASHNTITPAITAPGAQILAGSLDENGQFVAISGTSMSSPHVAGAAALLIADNPSWTPTEVRSALTLAANPDHRKEDGVTPADPFDMGTGRLDVAAAANIGFVMDESIANFEAANPALGGNPANLNLSSIKNWTCGGVCSYERTIRSVVGEVVDYAVTASMPPGVDISVTPESFTLGAGAEQVLSIEIDVSDASVPMETWLFGEINIVQDASQTTLGIQPALEVSAARMPVAVQSVEAQPRLVFPTTALSAEQESDEITTQNLLIANLGELPLEWAVTELGTLGTGPTFTGPGTIWDNPRSGTSGRINNFSNPDDTGIYQTDFFVLSTTARVEEILMEGFFLGGSLANATALTWMVFDNAGGVPAGHPETDPESALWSFTTTVDNPGVFGIGSNDMNLDLEAAGAPELELDAGIYWIVMYPDIPTFSLGPNILYAWFHGASGAGRQIAPQGLLGFPTDWSGVPEGRAFTLRGSLDCSSPQNIDWFSLDQSSGTLQPDEVQSLEATFDSASLPEGDYIGSLCLTSNDPDNAVALLSVGLSIENFPDGSVAPESIDMTLEFGLDDTATATISNAGKGELTFSTVGATAPESFGRRGTTGDVLWDQTANQTTSGALAIYDLDDPATWAVQAADDFVIPSGQQWQITTVMANGFYGGLVNPADSVRVFFYADDDGAPGTEVASFMDVNPAADDNGILTLSLPSTVTLQSGTWWVSVQPEMDFFDDGRWFWSMVSESVGGSFHWRNPGNGYGSGCTDWMPAADCGFSEPNLSFQILGNEMDACLMVDELPWLSVSPVAGTVAPLGGEQEIIFSFDASAVPPGNYTGQVCFETNDANNPLLSVAVDLTVEFPPDAAAIEGTVQSLGYCSANPAPAAGATVNIDGSLDQVMVTTDADGYYFAVLDAANAPVDISVSATDHLGGFDGGIGLTAGETTQVDFDLVLEAACATVAPQAFADAMLFGSQAQHTLTIGNVDGAATLVWAIQEAGVDEIQSLQACDDPGNVPWLSVSPFFGSVAAGGNAEVEVTVDSTGLAPGLYEAFLCVNTDDEQAALFEVPFALTVLGDEVFFDRFEAPEED